MDNEWVERLIVAGIVLLLAVIAARIADRAIARHFELRPETLTVYRVLRRSVFAVIIGVGVLSALSNFVAGILVAFAQPLRLGDGVTVAGASGTVQQIGLTYTVIRANDGARYFVPNAKLASDTIRNATIAGAEHLVAVRVAVPLTADLDRVLEILLQEAHRLPEEMTVKEPTASVTQLDPSGATVTVETWARTPAQGTELTSVLRRAIAGRLKAEGVYE